MPVEAFPIDLLASTYTRIRDADLILSSQDLIAKTWTAIDRATPYSIERFGYTYTRLVKAIPIPVDKTADTYTRINDIVWVVNLDQFFYLTVDHVDQWDFEIHDSEPYLDTNFFVPFPEYLDREFYIMSVDPYHDTTFNFAVYDFEDWPFDLRDDKPYLDVEFFVGIGGGVEINFLLYVPDYLDLEFEVSTAQYKDINILIPMLKYYREFNFRMKHIPMYLAHVERSFITKVTRGMNIDIELVSINRQLPATIKIRGVLR